MACKIFRACFCVSVRLLATSVNCTETDELIRMPFGMSTRGAQGTVFKWGSDSLREGAGGQCYISYGINFSYSFS